MNKILVIQTAFLGDAVLTLPLIQEIKNKYPNYLIDVLAMAGAVFFRKLKTAIRIIINSPIAR